MSGYYYETAEPIYLLVNESALAYMMLDEMHEECSRLWRWYYTHLENGRPHEAARLLEAINEREEMIRDFEASYENGGWAP